MKSLRKKITLFLLLISGFTAVACSCSYTFSEFTPLDLTSYNHIVSCRPISAETKNTFIIYKALTLKNYWGTANDTLTLISSAGSGGCGYLLNLHDDYLIYGNGAKEMYVSTCSPTRQLSKSRLWFSDEQPDSVNITLNGIYKKYPSDFLLAYFEKAKQNELKLLEQIAATNNGTIKTYFVNDSLSGIITIKDGKLNGYSAFYYADGKLHSEGNLANNLRENKWTENTFKIIRQRPYYFSSKGKYIRNEKSGLWKGKMLIGNYEDFKHYSHAAYKRRKYKPNCYFSAK